jgi:DNA-binding transcriptional MerR regulator
MSLYSTEPIFTTGTAAKITGIKPKTIINYDSSGLIDVSRSEKNRRLFSKKDLYELLLVKFLVKEKDLTFNAVRFFMDLKQDLKGEGVNLMEYVISAKKQKEFEERLNI